MGETENKYSGILTMRRKLKEYNLLDTKFNSKGDLRNIINKNS